MNEAAFVLQVIRDELDKQTSETVGKLALTDEALWVLDGKMKLSVVVRNDPDAHPAVAHCHVVADVADRSGCLDACVIGIDPDRREALADTARSWTETVAAPILSLMHARPVMGAAHFDGSQPWGVSGCHGFVGPMRVRLMDKAFDLEVLDDAPVFDYAAELAPPGIVHLAKATLQAAGDGGWNRNLEIDGHLAAYADHAWNVELPAPSQGIVSQFAVFHYGGQPDFVETRQRTDDVIRRFVSAFGTTNDTYRAAAMLVEEGVDVGLVHQVEAFVPLAFGRVAFESLGASFPPDFVRITRAGSLHEGLKLKHQPVFARSTALCREFMEGQLLEAVKNVALTSSEVNVINDALNAGSKPENLQLFPAVIPDPGTSDDAIQRAMEQLVGRAEQEYAAIKKAKPWWRFW